jgi:hypothetical protein
MEMSKDPLCCKLETQNVIEKERILSTRKRALQAADFYKQESDMKQIKQPEYPDL